MTSEPPSYSLGQIESPPSSPRYSHPYSPPLSPEYFHPSPPYSPPLSPSNYLPPSPHSPALSLNYFPPSPPYTLPSSPRYSPLNSPPYSPTSPHSPINHSWGAFPQRWTDDDFLWGIHDDGFTGLQLGNSDDEEELIPVERLVATSSIVDGTALQGVEVINNANDTNGVNNELNEVRIDGCSCPICYESCTTCGNHRICCLPCGHVYGLSCIDKWLQLRHGSNKCPQCKRSCTLQDARILYVTSQHTDDHETSLKNIISRMEALKLRVSAPEQRDDESEKLPTRLEQCVHALVECVNAIEAIETSLQRLSIRTAS